MDKLAEHLKISQRLLNRYITGDEPVPEPLVPLAIDVLLEGLPAVLPEQLTKKNTDSPAG